MTLKQLVAAEVYLVMYRSTHDGELLDAGVEGVFVSKEAAFDYIKNSLASELCDYDDHEHNPLTDDIYNENGTPSVTALPGCRMILCDYGDWCTLWVEKHNVQ